MSKSYLRRNLFTGLLITGVIARRGILSIIANFLRESGKYSICFLVGLTFWLMGVVAVEGQITSSFQQNTLIVNNPAQGHFRHTEANRRDPFKRIKKRTPTPSVSKNSHPEPAIVPGVQDPVWRLLGVMHGQDGHQAVIQISPKVRVVVQPGSELAGSGWTIKSISEGEVLLEHLSSSSLAGGSFPPRNFILSFPTIRKSP